MAAKHVVFAWELGAGYRYIAGFLPLANDQFEQIKLFANRCEELIVG